MKVVITITIDSKYYTYEYVNKDYLKSIATTLISLFVQLDS